MKINNAKKTLVNLCIILGIFGCNNTTIEELTDTKLTTVKAQKQKPVISYTIVDTNQSQCFGVKKAQECSLNNEKIFGQDAQYQGNQHSYTKQDNGTVKDNVTHLIWSQSTDINNDGEINVKDKLSYEEAVNYIDSLNLAGYKDWRLPTIKELYSLTLFDGQDPSGIKLKVGQSKLIPFIEHNTFDISTGDTKSGERIIDSQFVSSTKYVSTTMHDDDTVFGVNFIDGRIKGYGTSMPDGRVKTFYILAVRGNPAYGKNQFIENKKDTVLDQSTTLVWQQKDSFNQMNFVEALGYCENLSLAGFDDWRLPNVKELQSIVDYSKSPSTSNSASINSIFSTTAIKNENNKKDYANYWSSTTHINLKNGEYAAYISFGRSTGFVDGQWLDVHGAGAQRSDPKIGDANQYPEGQGPQGDSIRVNNMARCVRGGNVSMNTTLQYQQRQAMTIENVSNELTSSKPMQNSPITMMDKNGDGKISLTEARGPLKSDFTRLDRNNDGYLTEVEIPKKPRKK
jgi:hypothetical protein